MSFHSILTHENRKRAYSQGIIGGNRQDQGRQDVINVDFHPDARKKLEKNRHYESPRRRTS